MLLLHLPLRVDLPGNLVAKPFGFGEYLIQASEHLPEAVRGERLAFAVLGHSA